MRQTAGQGLRVKTVCIFEEEVSISQSLRVAGLRRIRFSVPLAATPRGQISHIDKILLYAAIVTPLLGCCKASMR